MVSLSAYTHINKKVLGKVFKDQNCPEKKYY
jgi:hypothetical protein